MMYNFTDDRSVPVFQVPALVLYVNPKTIGMILTIDHHLCWPRRVRSSPPQLNWTTRRWDVFPTGKSFSIAYTWGTTKQPHATQLLVNMIFTKNIQSKYHRVVPKFGTASTLWHFSEFIGRWSALVHAHPPMFSKNDKGVLKGTPGSKTPGII